MAIRTIRIPLTVKQTVDISNLYPYTNPNLTIRLCRSKNIKFRAVETKGVTYKDRGPRLISLNNQMIRDHVSSSKLTNKITFSAISMTIGNFLLILRKQDGHNEDKNNFQGNTKNKDNPYQYEKNNQYSSPTLKHN